MPYSCADLNPGSLHLLETSGPVYACTEIASPFLTLIRRTSGRIPGTSALLYVGGATDMQELSAVFVLSVKAITSAMFRQAA